jgi:hypothetical protein
VCPAGGKKACRLPPSLQAVFRRLCAAHGVDADAADAARRVARLLQRLLNSGAGISRVAIGEVGGAVRHVTVA